MTAREMFEKNGYKLVVDNDVVIVYSARLTSIKFNKLLEGYEAFYRDDCCANMIFMGVHKAIHQQLLELGWLDVD